MESKTPDTSDPRRAQRADNDLPVGLLPPSFDPEYVAGAVEPFLLTNRYTGERPALPMIDLILSKQDAAGAHMFGMLYDGWAPNGQEDGLTVFIQAYEDRGPNNERKKIYMSATSPDLCATKYADKIGRFLDRLFADANAGKPLMAQFYASYFDLYWDLHLGVTGADIPPEVREIGTSFNTVLGYSFPTLEIVREHYMRVRELREFLKEWIDGHVQSIIDGKRPDADRTFVYYWLKNGELGENFRRKDIVFECFHNFLAFSQWGNTTYNVMARLDAQRGDPAVRSWFERTMSNRPDDPDGSAFTPLDRFVMELFRTITPNPGSLSTMERQRSLYSETYSIMVTPHLASNMDPRHWENPAEFDPDRYLAAPTSVDNDEARARAAGLARCPFSKEPFAVKDGRQADLTNSAYGAVYAEIEGTAFPVCDTAGYAPFGFGYRRCAGEYLTVEYVKAFLRAVRKGGFSFVTLDLATPEKLPVGPRTVIDDNIAFTRRS
jgi:cytochrome P450